MICRACGKGHTGTFCPVGNLTMGRGNLTSGKSNLTTGNLTRQARYREKNKKEHREYMREYMRGRRA